MFTLISDSYAYTGKFLYRVPVDSNINRHHLQHQRSENGRLSHRSSSGSLDSMTESGALANELQNDS